MMLLRCVAILTMVSFWSDGGAVLQFSEAAPYPTREGPRTFLRSGFSGDEGDKSMDGEAKMQYTSLLDTHSSSAEVLWREHDNDLPQPARSNPEYLSSSPRWLQPSTDACQPELTDLNRNLAIIDARQEVAGFAETLAFDAYCTQPNRIRTTCVLDFVNASYTPNFFLPRLCADLGAMTVTYEYIFNCKDESPNVNPDNQFFYTGTGRPECYPFSCGSEGANLFVDEQVFEIMAAVEQQYNIACEVVRSTVSSVASNDGTSTTEDRTCEGETDTLMTSLSAQTEALINQVVPNIPQTCITSGAVSECQADFNAFQAESAAFLNGCDSFEEGLYLQVNHTLECVSTTVPEETMVVFGSGDPICVSSPFCTVLDFSSLANNQAELFALAVEADGLWTCTVQFARTGGEGFDVPTPAPTVTAAPTKENTCQGGSLGLNRTSAVQNEVLAIQRQLDEQPPASFCEESLDGNRTLTACSYDYSNLNNNLKTICEDAGGFYVDQIFTVRCTSDTYIKTWAFNNKPQCRHPDCNYQGIREILLDEMAWIGLNELRDNEDDLSLVCAFRDVVIYAGYGNPEEGVVTEVTPRCRDESNRIVSNITVFNYRTQLRGNMWEYSNTERRQICSSPVPRRLDCYFQWTDQFLPLPDDDPRGLRNMCAERGGQYLETSFHSACRRNGDEVLNMFNQNVPSCLSNSCSPGQSIIYLAEDQQHGWLGMDLGSAEGWTCQTSVSEVFSVDFIPTDLAALPATSAPTPFVTLSPTRRQIQPTVQATRPPTSSSSTSGNSSAAKVPKYSGTDLIPLYGMVAVGVLVGGFLLWNLWKCQRKRRARKAKEAKDRPEAEPSAEVTNSDDESPPSRGRRVAENELPPKSSQSVASMPDRLNASKRAKPVGRAASTDGNGLLGRMALATRKNAPKNAAPPAQVQSAEESDSECSDITDGEEFVDEPEEKKAGKADTAPMPPARSFQHSDNESESSEESFFEDEYLQDDIADNAAAATNKQGTNDDDDESDEESMHVETVDDESEEEESEEEEEEGNQIGDDDEESEEEEFEDDVEDDESSEEEDEDFLLDGTDDFDDEFDEDEE